MRASLAAAVIGVLLLAFGGVERAYSGGAYERPAATTDRARGLVFGGLRPARAGGPCKTRFELTLPGGRTGCTHGPDPAPAGHDVRRQRSTEELAASLGEGESSTEGTSLAVPCVGDGISGNRVQAVYAHPAGGPDNYAEIAPYIRGWAGLVDGVVNDSAAETGGVRHVRFVTDSDCRLDVAKVSLSDAGIASLAGTIAELADQGHDRSDRKYLVWVDAYVYCGVATLAVDERPAQDNLNNSSDDPGMVARVDRGCWGHALTSAETHELVHVLGGVQLGAPNATDGFHCADEGDLMCYDDDGGDDGMASIDGKPAPLRYLCPDSHERLLDCNHDDYFHTDPQAGSYLADHWNVASSSFLTPEGAASMPDTTAPVPTGPVPAVVGRLGNRTVAVRLSWSTSDPDVAGYWLWQSVDGEAWTYVETSNPSSLGTVLTLRRGHSYRFLVHAYDRLGNASEAVLGPRFKVRVYEERHRRISYGGKWRRQYRSFASGRHHASPRTRTALARVRFRGRAVALVSRTTPRGGRARVYVDGRYVRTVRLYSPTVSSKTVVFSRAWRSSKRHTLSVRAVRAPRRVPLDAVVVLR